MKTFKFSLTRYNSLAIAIIIGLAVHQVAYGLLTVVPTNINWLMAAYHDWGTHYLGWAFYRFDEWSFPIGSTSSYFYPQGTNVGFTDTIPIMAFIGKIFSPLLPADFQYFGFWMLLCHTLVAYYVIRILNLFKVNWVVVVLATIIITANPVLVFRSIHPSLCAHWLLLASVYYYLLPSHYCSPKKLLARQCGLFILAATINPYLAFMIAGFLVALPTKQYFYDKSISIKTMIVFPVIAIVLVLLFWIVFGLIEFGKGTNLDVGDIYGLYAMNLDSFFNSFGFYSHFLPSLGMVTDRQHEGFAYLGLGMIVLVAVSLVAFAYFMRARTFRSRLAKFLPLFAVCLIFALFAISNKVSWRTEILFEYPTLPVIKKLGNIFRAIGRFIWPAYYCILLFAFVIFSKIRISNFLKIGIIVALTGLQLYDTENLLTIRDLKGGAFNTKLNDDKWLRAFKEFDEIVTYPPFTNNLVYNQDYQDVCFLALKAHKPISNGYVARENLLKSKEFRDTIMNQILRAQIPKGRLYVTNAKNLGDFQELIKEDGVKLRKVDGFIWIYAKEVAVPGGGRTDAFNDSVARYYKSRTGYRLMTTSPQTSEKITFNLEDFRFENDLLVGSGWAFHNETTNNKKDSIFITLHNTKTFCLIPAQIIARSDISTMFKKPLDSSGFKATLYARKLPKAIYEVGIAIKDATGNVTYKTSGRTVEVGSIPFKTPKKIVKLANRTTKIMGNIEHVNEAAGIVRISGWSALNDKGSQDITIRLVLSSDKSDYAFSTDVMARNDVTILLKNTFNYDNCGFSLAFKTKALPKGKYKIGVLLTENATGTKTYRSFDNSVIIPN